MERPLGRALVLVETVARWIIVGAGFTGTRIAQKLAFAGGNQIIVTRRRHGDALAAAAAAGAHVTALAVDLDDATSCAALTQLAAGAVIVHSAPPSSNAAEANLLTACAAATRIVYISSTGVYGAGHGQVVDETAPIAPLSHAGQLRAAAEARLQQECNAAQVPLVMLRASGIYGGSRSLIGRARSGMMRIIGDGSTIVCRIHVDDLASAAIAAGRSTVTGAVNVSDDDHASMRAVTEGVCAALGLAPPAATPADAVTGELAAMLLANRRISNRRLHDDLGVTLEYPSWRTTLAAELAALGEGLSAKSAS